MTDDGGQTTENRQTQTRKPVLSYQVMVASSEFRAPVLRLGKATHKSPDLNYPEFPESCPGSLSPVLGPSSGPQELAPNTYFHIRTAAGLTLKERKNFSTAFFSEKGTVIHPLASFFPFRVDRSPGYW